LDPQVPRFASPPSSTVKKLRTKNTSSFKEVFVRKKIITNAIFLVKSNKKATFRVASLRNKGKRWRGRAGVWSKTHKGTWPSPTPCGGNLKNKQVRHKFYTQSACS
jgi:hypothetical protein